MCGCFPYDKEPFCTSCTRKGHYAHECTERKAHIQRMINVDTYRQILMKKTQWDWRKDAMTRTTRILPTVFIMSLIQKCTHTAQRNWLRHFVGSTSSTTKNMKKMHKQKDLRAYNYSAAEIKVLSRYRPKADDGVKKIDIDLLKKGIDQAWKMQETKAERQAAFTNYL